MIPEPQEVKRHFTDSLAECRELFGHCLTPRGLHTDYGIEAAFLQFHKAWETFLEDSMLCFLCGKQPLSGEAVIPRFTVSDYEVARKVFYQGQAYKEWTNKDEIIKRYRIFFETPKINEKETNRLIDAIMPISPKLVEILNIRNVIAHSSYSAENKIKELYQQKFGGNPSINRPAEFLIKDDRESGMPYFSSYLSLIEITAEKIIG